jgi:D-alanine-D-alanine ligase
MDEKIKKVGLVLGGASPEREVSKLSAKSVYEALLNNNYEVVLIDPALGSEQSDNPDDYFSNNNSKHVTKDNYVKSVNSGLYNDVDIVFNALHGKWGEDGTIQSLFELSGIPYTGSGVLASSISMNKAFSKVMFKHNDVSTPEWFVVDKENINLSDIDEFITKTFDYPCVVKPNDQGSAIGLSICYGFGELDEAMKTASSYCSNVIIEDYIAGHEITVGILGHHCYPVLEIKPKHDFYDYTCKYTHGMSEYEVPAKFPQNTLQLIQEQAMKAFTAVGCKVYGRLDFRLSENLHPYCLEVNTLPGLTSTSLLPKTAKADGTSFDELIQQIIIKSLRNK